MPQQTIILMARFPRPGRVKTRLIPALGPEGAAEVYRQLAEKTARECFQAAETAPAGLEIHFSGGDVGAMADWLGDCPSYIEQSPGDIGQRMAAALTGAFDRGADRAVLVGSDLIGLEAEYLTEALAGLRQADVVLGPARDGGYWLIGLNQGLDADWTELFRGIDWSTPAVLDQTLARARELDLSVGLARELADLDTPADLARILGGGDP